MTIIRHDDPTYERRPKTPMRYFKGGKGWNGMEWEDGGCEMVMIFLFGVDIPIMICFDDDDDDELEFPLVFVVLIVLFLFCNVVVSLHG